MSINKKDLTEQLEYLQDTIKFKDELTDQRRITVLTQIDTLRKIYLNKLNLWEHCEEFQAGEMHIMAEWKAIHEMLDALYNDVINLDNDRVQTTENIAKIACLVDNKHRIEAEGIVYKYANS